MDYRQKSTDRVIGQLSAILFQTLETSDRYSSFLNPSSLAGAIVEKDIEIGLLALAHKIWATLYAAGPRPFSIPNVYA